MADENETPSWLTENPPAPAVADIVPAAAPAPAAPAPLPAVKMTDASAAATASNPTELTGEIENENYTNCHYSVHDFFHIQRCG